MSVKDRLRPLYHQVKAIPQLIRERPRSQFAEDSLFFAAMSPKSDGFYVDVGAHHPTDGSNTSRLYLHGWRGITIEPNPAVEKLFLQQRPRDIHVCEGVSKGGGVLEYYEYSHSVYNTFSDERVAALSAEGIYQERHHDIATRPLADILHDRVPVTGVDLLTVDCEGLDLEVLETANLPQLRPIAVMVEDFEGFRHFQSAGPLSPLQRFMRENDYQPIAQALLTTLYISRSWRELFERSRAFDPADMQLHLLPL